MCHSQYRFIEHIARCIDSSGTREFFEPFFEMLLDFFGVDQCMIFLLDPQSQMQCLLSRNFLDKVAAAPLAKAYVEGGYNSDPNLESLNKLMIGDAQTIHFSDMADQISEGYREQFFGELHLVDKVSILTADECGKYYINFYRGEG